MNCYCPVHRDTTEKRAAGQWPSLLPLYSQTFLSRSVWPRNSLGTGSRERPKPQAVGSDLAPTNCMERILMISKAAARRPWKVCRAGFSYRLSHFLAVWLWASDWTSLSLPCLQKGNNDCCSTSFQGLLSTSGSLVCCTEPTGSSCHTVPVPAATQILDYCVTRLLVAFLHWGCWSQNKPQHNCSFVDVVGRRNGV